MSCSGCYAFAVTFLAENVRNIIKICQYRTPAELKYIYYRIGIFSSWTISARTFLRNANCWMIYRTIKKNCRTGRSRNEILIDQQRDVVIVFLAWCIPLIWRYSPRTDTVYTSTAVGGEGLRVKSGALASNKQNTRSPKYNDDIPLLISQYLISGEKRLHLWHGF